MEFFLGSEVVVTVAIGVFLAVWAANEEARSQRRRRSSRIKPKWQEAAAMRKQS